MIITLGRSARRLKKKEWNVYENIGVQHDARRFSLIDDVLDGEYSDHTTAVSEKNMLTKPGIINRMGLWFKSNLFKSIFRSYLFCWFSIYYSISIFGKFVK